MTRAVLLLLMVSLAAAGPAEAKGRFTLETVYQEQEWEELEGGPKAVLSQATVRAQLGVAMSPSLHLDVMSVGTWSDFDPFEQYRDDDAGESVGGMPARARLTYTLNDRWMVRVGGGTAMVGDIADDELALARTLAVRILEMPTNLLRDGYAVDAGVAYARPVGDDFAVGVGAGYLYKGGYTVVDPEFIPGAQISLGGGVDYEVPSVLCRANGRVVLYGNDQLDDADLQQEGPRVEGQVLVNPRFGTGSFWVSASYVHFLKGKVLGAGGDLVDAEEAFHGDEVYAEVGAEQRLSPGTRAALRLGGRNFAADDRGLGGARQITAHLTLGWTVSPAVTVEITGGVNAGTLEDPHPVLRNTAKSDLSGYTAGLRLVRDF